MRDDTIYCHVGPVYKTLPCRPCSPTCGLISPPLKKASHPAFPSGGTQPRLQILRARSPCKLRLGLQEELARAAQRHFTQGVSLGLDLS